MPRVNRVSRMVKLKPFAAATMGGAFCEYEGLVTLKENWYRTKASRGLTTCSISVSCNHMPYPCSPSRWLEKKVWQEANAPHEVFDDASSSRMPPGCRNAPSSAAMVILSPTCCYLSCQIGLFVPFYRTRHPGYCYFTWKGTEKSSDSVNLLLRPAIEVDCVAWAEMPATARTLVEPIPESNAVTEEVEIWPDVWIISVGAACLESGFCTSSMIA